MLAAVVGVRNVETRSRAGRSRQHPGGAPPARLAAGARAKSLFFASTSEVYAGGVAAGMVPVPTPEDVPLSVPDIAAPRFAYAVSKILGEAAVLHTARARGLRRGGRPLPQRLRSAHGRRPRHPRDGAAGAPARGPVPGLRGRAAPRVLPRRGRGRGDWCGSWPRRRRGADRQHRQRHRGDAASTISPRSSCAWPRFEPAIERAPRAGRLGGPALPGPRAACGR